MPELLLYNAQVITMDPRRPFGELVAIQDGTIRAVTGNHHLEGLKTPGTQVIDCGGRTLLPGFIDAHCHFRAFAKRFLTLDLSPASGIGSIADIKAGISCQAEMLPPGTWIRGQGYHEFDLADKRHPMRWDLDKVSPHHPVKLSHKTGHAHVLNSMALNLIGLSRYSAEPEGGLMDRDLDTGEPTGLLYEMGSFLAERVPRIEDEEMEEGITKASRLLLSLGVTSLYDASSRNDIQQWKRFARWKENGRLPQKIGMFVNESAMAQMIANRFHYPKDPFHLRPLGIKIILDETTGRLHPQPEVLQKQVSRAHGLGFQVAIHAVEEKAIEAACHAIENALSEKPRFDHRHRLEHAFVCTPDLISRIASLGINVVTQPGFLYENGDRYVKTVPEEKQRYLYPIGSFIQNGVAVAAGSDGPVGPMNPFLGIHAAVSRTTPKGVHLNVQERVFLLNALALYTCNAASTAFEETSKGSITPGKTGDLILLNGDLLRSEPKTIKDMKVDATILDGRIVWERNNLLLGTH